MSPKKRCSLCPTAAKFLYKSNPYCATCINGVPADAPIVPVDKRQRAFRQQITEIDVSKNYSGEASPYWDHIHAVRDTTGEGIGVTESAPANPDILSDEEGLYDRPLTSDGALMAQAVHETLTELSLQQRTIMQMASDGVWSDHEGSRVFTLQAIADALKISRNAVDESLIRTKIKIRRRYEKLKAAAL